MGFRLPGNGVARFRDRGMLRRTAVRLYSNLELMGIETDKIKIRQKRMRFRPKYQKARPNYLPLLVDGDRVLCPGIL